MTRPARVHAALPTSVETGRLPHADAASATDGPRRTAPPAHDVAPAITAAILGADALHPAGAIRRGSEASAQPEPATRRPKQPPTAPSGDDQRQRRRRREREARAGRELALLPPRPPRPARDSLSRRLRRQIRRAMQQWRQRHAPQPVGWLKAVRRAARALGLSGARQRGPRPSGRRTGSQEPRHKVQRSAAGAIESRDSDRDRPKPSAPGAPNATSAHPVRTEHTRPKAPRWQDREPPGDLDDAFAPTVLARREPEPLNLEPVWPLEALPPTAPPALTAQPATGAPEAEGAKHRERPRRSASPRRHAESATPTRHPEQATRDWVLRATWVGLAWLGVGALGGSSLATVGPAASPAASSAASLAPTATLTAAPLAPAAPAPTDTTRSMPPQGAPVLMAAAGHRVSGQVMSPATAAPTPPTATPPALPVHTPASSATELATAPAIAPAPAPAAAPEPSTVPSTADPAVVGGLDCMIQPSQLVNMGAPTPGVIAELLVDRGDRVQAGQPVARLNDSVERAALALARARAGQQGEVTTTEGARDLAERELERADELYRKRFVSATYRDKQRAEARMAGGRNDEAREKRELASRELALAQAQLAQRTLRSPISGIVIERHMALGEYVDQKPVLRLAQIDPLRVDVLVPASQFGRIHVGSIGTVTPELLAARALTARVSTVDQVIDAASNTFRVRLELPNPDHGLPAGLRCRVDLAGAPTEAASLPPAATGEMGHTMERAAGARRAGPSARGPSVAPTPAISTASSDTARSFTTGSGSAQR